MIQAKIPNGRVIISGRFSKEEADSIAAGIKPAAGGDGAARKAGFH
jgi:hypothetical protein